MNNLRLVSSGFYVNRARRAIAESEIKKGKDFDGGIIPLTARFCYYLLSKHKELTPRQLRGVLAVRKATYKGEFSESSARSRIDKKHVGKAELGKLRELFLRLEEESRDWVQEKKDYLVLLPSRVVDALCDSGDRLGILACLFGATKQNRANKLTFVLPKKFLAERLGATRRGVMKAIGNLVRSGIITEIRTPYEDIKKFGKRYSFTCSHHLALLEQYPQKLPVKKDKPKLCVVNTRSLPSSASSAGCQDSSPLPTPLAEQEA